MADDNNTPEEEKEDAGGVSDDALAEVFEEEVGEEVVAPIETEDVSLDAMAEEEEEGALEEGFDDVDDF